MMLTNHILSIITTILLIITTIFVLCNVTNTNNINILQLNTAQFGTNFSLSGENCSDTATIIQYKLSQINKDKFPGEYLDTLSQLRNHN